MSYINKDGDIHEGEDFSDILDKLKMYLLAYYVPVHDPKNAEFHLSTREIHQQLLKLYPNELILTADLVAKWLNNGGFTFYDFGEKKFEWLMKKK